MKTKFLLQKVIIVLLIVFSGNICSSQSLQELKKAERSYWQGDRSQYNKIMKAFLKGGVNTGEIALILGKMRRPEAIPPLIELIKSDSKFTPQVIIALEMMGNPNVVPYLIQVIKEDNPFAVNAVKALGNLKDKRAVPILMKVIDEQRPYNIEAVEALGKIGDKSAVSLLMEYFLKPAETEPDEILLKVTQEGKDPQKAGTHERYFNVEKNLPPKVEVLNFFMDPVGKVFFEYQLSDTELDTLFITPEYSEDGGLTWKNATIEGKVDNFTGVIYRNNLVWRSEQDSITISSQTNLIFRITPSDQRNNIYRGIPAVMDFTIDSTPLSIKNLTTELSGDIVLTVYYPRIEGGEEKRFYFNYSFNNGRNWFPGTTYRTTPSGLSTPDSLWYIWRSEEDLRGDDFNNIIIRVSSYGDSTIGRHALSNSFHLDNNEPPTVEIANTKENGFFEIAYRIIDAEDDLVDLEVDYSTNAGRSWQRATISGDLKNLSPLNYDGTIYWYSDFDITYKDRDKPVIFRITPIDNDRGLSMVSRELLLNDPFYSKLTKGSETGDISVRYNFAVSDTTTPLTEYSIDGGKTWTRASISDLDINREREFQRAKINWSMGKDINGYHRRMAAAASSMDQIGDENIVPQLLKILTRRFSPKMSERQRAIEAARLFEKRPQWIISGLIKSLISDDPTVHVTAVQILETIDTPEVVGALRDYNAYWNQMTRNEQEESAMKQEDVYQEIVASVARRKVPTRDELMGFLYKQGVTKQEAFQYYRDLDFFVGITKLKEDLDAGRISSSEYDKRILKLLDEIRARKQVEEKIQ